MLSKFEHCYKVSDNKHIVLFTIKCNKGGIGYIPVTVGTDKTKLEKYLKKAIGKAIDRANHYAKGVKLA